MKYSNDEMNVGLTNAEKYLVGILLINFSIKYVDLMQKYVVDLALII